MSARIIPLAILALCLCTHSSFGGAMTEPTTKPALPPQNEALMHAIKKGDVELAKKLIAEGAPANTAGIPPLWYAAILSRHEIAKILLDHGADPNFGEFCGDTCHTVPIQVATATGDVTMIKMLLEAGARKAVNQCLVAAARRGQREIVILMLDAGADPNWKGPDGEDTSAIETATLRHPDIAESMRHYQRAP